MRSRFKAISRIFISSSLNKLADLNFFARVNQLVLQVGLAVCNGNTVYNNLDGNTVQGAPTKLSSKLAELIKKHGEEKKGLIVQSGQHQHAELCPAASLNPSKNV